MNYQNPCLVTSKSLTLILTFLKRYLLFTSIHFPNKKWNQKINLFFRNHRHGILWPFQNIFFSFPFPKKHFSTGRTIQMEPPLKFVPGLTEIFFFQISAFSKKSQCGWSSWCEWNGTVCFGGCLNKNLPKMVTRQSPLSCRNTQP